MSAQYYLLEDSPNTLQICFSGNWSIHSEQIKTKPLENFIEAHPKINKVIFSSKNLESWDSSLIRYLLNIKQQLESHQIHIEYQQIPEGVISLIRLAQAVPKRADINLKLSEDDLATRVGKQVLASMRQLERFTFFMGEAVFAFGRLLKGKAIFRKKDIYYFIYDSGPGALAIVSLISILIGMIMAFVGAVQLEKFGAGIYVASLVGLSMAREMASMMTGIIMTGRTGAAFAAQLGSMQVNEEIDGLKTMGVSSFDFLVLPRILALIVMMPLLTIYANLMGIIGGGFVGVTMLDLTWPLYFDQLYQSVPIKHFIIGLFKSFLFGILIALAGCFKGMHSGRSATAVGQATTAAVVLGIVLIIVCDALVTIITTVMDI